MITMWGTHPVNLKTEFSIGFSSEPPLKGSWNVALPDEEARMYMTPTSNFPISYFSQASAEVKTNRRKSKQSSFRILIF